MAGAHHSICIAVCTHNRADTTLAPCLDSIIDAIADTQSHNLCIVLSACNDDSQSVARKTLSGTSLPAEVISVDKPGLSLARNAALAYAVSKNCHWILYVDDDALASPGWSQRMAIAAEKQSWSYCGGAVTAHWPCDTQAVPRWVLQSPFLLGQLSLLDVSSLTPLQRITAPFGGNSMWDVDIVSKFGGFSEDLGRSSDCLLSGEESLLALRLFEHGHLGGLVPECNVAHMIPRSRLTHLWFLTRAYWQGVTQFRLLAFQSKAERQTRTRLNRTRLLNLPVRWLYHLCTMSPHWYGELCLWTQELALLWCTIRGAR